MPFSRYCFFPGSGFDQPHDDDQNGRRRTDTDRYVESTGYSKSSIAGKYVFYALLATVGGSVLGVLAGEKIFPYVIIDAYRIMYQHMDGMVLDYQLDHALVASLVALFCTMQERFLPVERNWQVHRRSYASASAQRR